ncbi:MAG: hypothetical protein RL038_1117 [Actinomycetota bacterium]
MTSKVFDFADHLVSEMAERDPMLAIELGIPINALPDYSVAKNLADLDFYNRKLEELNALIAESHFDEVAISVMRERLNVWRDGLLAEDYLSDLNNLASPIQNLRMIFDLLPADAMDSGLWVALVTGLPAALNSYRETLETGLSLNKSASARQARTAAKQCFDFGAYFTKTAAENGTGVAEAEIAALSFEQFGDWLESTYAEKTQSQDGVGPERYEREIRRWTGAKVDAFALHEWGWQELTSIYQRMQQVAEKIAPGTTPAGISKVLDADERYVITGEAEILAFLRKITDTAIAELRDSHFKIDPKIEFCDIKIAPEGSASAPYYMPPAEDFSRAGTTFLPKLGTDKFHTWHLVSTWYHEAVPGHHLQMGATMLMDEQLSRFQRTVGWTSGYAEGWALYAERLMDELGYFSDSGFEMGFLSAQALRAARVVVDTGMHLGLKTPVNALGIEPGQPIDYEFSRNLLQTHALQAPDVAESETIRYLGLPAQAISYKLGEKMILELREAAKQKADFDLALWHQSLLNVGPVGLDTLKLLLS